MECAWYDSDTFTNYEFVLDGIQANLNEITQQYLDFALK